MIAACLTVGWVLLVGATVWLLFGDDESSAWPAIVASIMGFVLLAVGMLALAFTSAGVTP